jgi:exopolysaccharide/PEP-CTERM locus tyrosine autokinase
MAESIGLIERAGTLLRRLDANESDPLPSPAGKAAAGPGGPELVLDRGLLASYGITVPSSARSRTVEEFRLVKRNLMTQFSQGDFGTDQRSGRLIMVTSARPGEGKTFISLNLALAFASERDVKALLVDVDTQHSTLRTILGISTEQGIVDVLAGNRELSEVLIQTNILNFMVLPSGRGGPHVPELLSSNKMAVLMAEMTRRFADRYIIIDTPPCMASSDAAALAPLVGQIVFIVEAHHTQQVEIEACLSMLSPCPRISLLLNKSDTMAGEHFGSYEDYYYSQGRESDVPRSGKPA